MPHLRRSCLAVPASNVRMIEKAAASAADAVFLDLEDACAPSEKNASRGIVVAALRDLDWGTKTRTVRINDATTGWCHRDVIEVVTGAREHLDCLMLTKVADASHVHFVHHLLQGLEADLRLTKRIGLELLIETASGATHVMEIARACPSRTETLIFGPGDYAVDVGVPRLELGMIDPEYPGHQWHWVMSEIVAHARTVGVQAIDGPYVDFNDPDGYAEAARRAKLLGFDGKWAIHPNQIAWANNAFTPEPTLFAQALRTLTAYAEASAAGIGAAVLDGKMIDEATRKLAGRIVAYGRAAGLEEPSQTRLS